MGPHLNTRCRSRLPDIMDLTTTKMKSFEKYYPEYSFPIESDVNKSHEWRLAQTRYWKSILVKHGYRNAATLPHRETSLELTYPRLINLFYLETEGERIHNQMLWNHWRNSTFCGNRINSYTPGYKTRKSNVTEVQRWKVFVEKRKRDINEKIISERIDMEFIM
jgi:hypothetical protein